MSDEAKELTHNGFRIGAGEVTYGWWYVRGQWGLGVGLTHEEKSPCWSEKWTFALEVGPLQWGMAWEGDRR